MPANNGRPLPWHDTPTCDASDGQYAGVSAERGVCGGPMVPVGKIVNGHSGPSGARIVCVACGHGRVGTSDEVARAERSSRAWELYESGEIHQDRGCARCNGPLPLDRSRLCAPCVEKDNAERQASLFSEVTS